MNPNHVALLTAAATVIGFAIRVLKSGALERAGLPTPPKRALPWIALGLGVAGGIVSALQAGEGWPAVLARALDGLVAGIGAIAGHELVIESARGGKEIPAPDAPPPGMLQVFALVAALPLVAGCGAFWADAKPVLRTLLTVAEEACVWRAQSSDPAWVKDACGIRDVADPVLEQLLAAKQSAQRAGVYAPTALRPGAAPAPACPDTDGGRP